MNPDTSKEHSTDQARRRLLRSLFTAPVLMSIPGRQVFAGACTLSGMMSGNVSNTSDDCSTRRTFGLGPRAWTRLDTPCLVDREWTRFADVFGSDKFADLSLLETLKVSARHKAFCGKKSRHHESHGEHDEGKHHGKKKKHEREEEKARYRPYCDYAHGERKLARYAIAAYLNAYDARHGGGLVDPDYFFTPEQVVGLYQAVENGGGNYTVNGITYFFTREAVIRLFEDSWR